MCVTLLYRTIEDPYKFEGGGGHFEPDPIKKDYNAVTEDLQNI